MANDLLMPQPPMGLGPNPYGGILWALRQHQYDQGHRQHERALERQRLVNKGAKEQAMAGRYPPQLSAEVQKMMIQGLAALAPGASALFQGATIPKLKLPKYQARFERDMIALERARDARKAYRRGSARRALYRWR